MGDHWTIEGAGLKSPTPSGELAVGTVVDGRFRITAHVGTGSTGSVHAADDLLLGQRVALKIFPTEIADDPRALRRLYDEVALTRAITDRHVCRVYDVGRHVDPVTCQSRPFLTMELVRGSNLEARLAGGRLPLRAALDIAGQICAGLRAAHDRGVLHRDLKAANVLVDPDGQVRLTDFGLARSRTDVEVANGGTPAAMAPEQLVGRGASLQSDLFSLGLLLYELFTGVKLLQVDTIDALVRAHERFHPRSPRNLRPELDRRLARAVLSCLATDPNQRPASATVVERAVRRAQMGEVHSLRHTLTTTLPAFVLALFGLNQIESPTPAPLAAAQSGIEVELVQCSEPEQGLLEGNVEIEHARTDCSAPCGLPLATQRSPVRPWRVHRYTAASQWHTSGERTKFFSARSS